MKKTAADTNIVVRLLVDDGSAQCQVAADLLTRFQMVISKTVMLETEWVLRGVMKTSRERINFLLSGLLVTPNVELENASEIETALTAHAKGMDFADALHLVALEAGSTFMTFDNDLVKRAPKQFSHLTVELAQ